MEAKSLPKAIQWFFSISTFITSVLLLTLVLFALDTFSAELNDSLDAILFGTIAAGLTFVLLYIFDRNTKLENMLKLKGISLKWLIIIPISLIISIIGLIIYATLANFDLYALEDINLSNPANIDLLAFLISNASINIISYLLYFGIKNLPRFSPIKIPKYPVFAAISLIFLVVSSYGAFYVYNNFYKFPPATILGGNGYTDGPWLTWQDDPSTTMTVSWLTDQRNTTVVKYGESPANLDQTYSVNDFVNMHHAELTGLSPETTYYYRIYEDFEQDHYSDLFNFTTAPDSAYPKAFKCAVYGDVQPTDAAYVERNQLVADGLIAGDFDFVLQTGDLADSGQDMEDWHRTFQSLARVGATTPIQAAIGNHDWDGASGSSNWAEVFDYEFPDPNQGRYYSFDYLNAHFVMLDNFEHTYSMSSRQLKWIENDINSARAEDPDCWVFCFFHLALMTTATSGHYYDLQKQLVPIFDKTDVDAVFYGHDHHYGHYNYTYGETNPGRFFDPSHDWDHNEIQYFCTGGGGANLEVTYGVLEDGMNRQDQITWWNESLNDYETVEYDTIPWNDSKYVEHAGWDPNYTTPGIHAGKYYYHAPDIECYNEYAQELGFDYGEQCYQYMQIEVNADGSQCTISARYPNGNLISGPGGAYPQTWTFVK